MALEWLIPWAISDAVKSVKVDAPSSSERPLTKEISKSFISKDFSYESILKFFSAWFKINLSVFPDLAIDPFSSYF